MTQTIKKPALQPLLLVCILFITAFVYYPGLSGHFVLDDLPNIVHNKRLHITSLDLASLRQAAFSMSESLLHSRPISMLSLALNYYTSTTDAQPYKITNLIIHLLNGLTLLALTRLLLQGFAQQKLINLTPVQQNILPIAVAAAWLLHPLGITSVLYIVQRMNSLSSLFISLGLISYLSGRLRLEEGKRGFARITFGLIGCGALATLCKENGLLLPVYALLIEVVVFQHSSLSGNNRRAIDTFFALLVILPVLGAAAFIAGNPDWLNAQYQMRSFSLSERLLTEARILWLYLRWIIIPTTNDTGLFHDDIAVSHDLFNPTSTLPAVMGLAALALLAGALRKRQPLFCFGVLWFLVGQSMESTIVWLELAHEHRNYLPMYGILFAASTALLGVKKSLITDRLAVRVAVFLTFLVLFTFVTAQRAYQWRDNTTLFLSEAQHHPLSYRANYSTGRQYSILLSTNPEYNATYFSRSKRYLEEAARLEPERAEPLFAILYFAHTNGQAFDAVHWNEITRRLSHQPDPTMTTNLFMSLVLWQEEKSTHLSTAQVLALFDAAITNPMLPKLDRAMILSTLSGYYANTLHRYDKALQVAQMSIDTAPTEAIFHISMAQLNIALNMFPEARQHLDQVKALDTVHHYRADIASLDSQIKAHGR